MASNPLTSENMSKAGDAAKDKLNTAANMANEAGNRAAQLGKQTVDKLDASRGPIAEGIGRTADALRYGPEKVAAGARTTAEAFDEAAEYIRSRDLRSMASDLTAAVRRNPTPSLIAAVAVGFLLGHSLRRD